MFQRGYLKTVVVVSFSMLALVLMAGPGYAKDKDLTQRVADLEAKVAALEAKLQYMSVQTGTINGLKGPHVIFQNANVHIRSGSGSTSDGCDFDPNCVLSGLGNLIVGYNENTAAHLRTGSHNLIVGWDHEFTSYAGYVCGQLNRITAPFSAVSGGVGNQATSNSSVVSGGFMNTASGINSVISGGVRNTASGQQSVVSGGEFNTASGIESVVSGGSRNTASGNISVVSGGSNKSTSVQYGYVDGD